MIIRNISNIDIIDKYLIISISAIYLIIPLIFEINFDRYNLSQEIWIGLIISTFISLIMILSKNTPNLEIEKLRSIPKIFSSKTIFFFLFVLFIFEIFELFKIINEYDKSITRDSLFYNEDEQSAIGGRNLFSYLKMLTNSLMLIVFVDIFHLNRPRNKILIYFFVLIIIIQYSQLFFTSIYRSTFLSTIIFWVLFINFYINELKFTKKNIIFIFLFFLIGSYWLSWSAFYRQGDIAEINQINIFHGLSGLATAFEIESLKEAIEIGALKLEYGLQMFYNLISWIPRMIWEEKPLVSFSFRISSELYDEVGITTWVRTFTIPGEGYLQFGVPGMILWSILFIYFYRFSKLIVIKYPLSLPFFLGLWASFPLLVRGDLFSYISRFFVAVSVFIFIFFIFKLLKLSLNTNKKILKEI